MVSKFSVLMVWVMGGMTIMSAQSTFDKVDEWARTQTYQGEGIDQFTKETLTAPFTEPIDKVRSIYVWITHTIAYDLDKFFNPDPIQIRASSYEEALEKKTLLDLQNVEKTLKRRKGICGDYSALFKLMCEAIDMEAVVVPGFSRNILDQPNFKASPDHAWNAFRIKDEWYLVDATWGSGHLSQDRRSFVKRFFNYYFMTPPSEMIKSHYPVESTWQLLEDPVDQTAFMAQPLYFPLYRELEIKHVLPGRAKIQGGEVTFVIEGDKVDPEKLAIIQNGQVVDYGFVKDGKVFSKTVNLKGKRSKMYIGYFVNKTTVEPLVQYEW